MHIAYIAFGSNMGDRHWYIKQAIEKLKDYEIEVVKVSNLYETKPYGYIDQGNFINGVAQIKTEYSPQELLKKLQLVESALGRVREIHWGPRTIDLDILLYDNIIMETKELIIPHADMQNRRFVLEPLCNLTPDYRHPVLKKSILELLDELTRK